MTPWLLKKASATVLPEILSGVLFFTSIALLLSVLAPIYQPKIAVNSVMLGVVSLNA